MLTLDIAKKAVEEFRFPIIKGKMCRVIPYSAEFQKIDGCKNAAALSDSCQIYVKGFAKANWTHVDLYKAFS